MYLVLLGIWIILNGKITLEIVIFGLVICAMLYAFLCRFLNYSVKKDLHFLKRIPGVVYYAVVLIKEIIKANLAVIHLIVSGRDEIQPVLVNFKTKLKSETARAFMANAITLTPGTITVSLTDQELLVHCLDKSLAEGMEDSEFVKLLEQMEGATA